MDSLYDTVLKFVVRTELTTTKLPSVIQRDLKETHLWRFQNVWKFLGTMLKRDVLITIKSLVEEDEHYIFIANEWRKILNWADDLHQPYPCPNDPVDDLLPVYIFDFLDMNFKVDEALNVPPLVQYGLAYEKYLQQYFEEEKCTKLLHFCQLLKSEKYDNAQSMDLDD